MAGFFKTNIRLVYLKFDKDAYIKDLKEKLEVQNRQAARAWLRAVILNVPVWTGEARGSLRPLGQFLRVNVPINPSSSKWAQRAIAQGHTAEAGAAQGKFEFKIEGQARVIFEFETSVIHYLINEFYNVKPPIHLINEVPWYSLKAGKAAYKTYVNENVRKSLPKLKSYLIREVRTISGAP